MLEYESRNKYSVIFRLMSKCTMSAQLAIGCGLTVTAVSSGSIPKFGIYGTPVTHAGLMIAEAPEEAILLGPTTRIVLQKVPSEGS